MNYKLLFLLVVLGMSILVFVWGTTNYLRCYTDTPSGNYYESCPRTPDVHAIPAVIATFVMIGIVPIITWIKTKSHKLQIVFTVLSGVGIFFVFVGILYLILMVRN
ncbi:hypothetical protein NZNM25_07900 [Nitrosopumilus zosterae]|uniref:Uncharacterized protein n=1 Tax=Nitrosopumilus zosterae TaxID=718286 RepID=A0A2S2KQR9_9ARCH|nr:hypothetical protein [Nitrosopumilus zosterae]BDQ30569.1 hypothetical protein NZOSNM25_000674 [Nitrosopumilus zosterae]GBH33999.1 hypothetical protein NZNM25_07900 [Nitrosopumilus zosterae]